MPTIDVSHLTPVERDSLRAYTDALRRDYPTMTARVYRECVATAMQAIIEHRKTPDLPLELP